MFPKIIRCPFCEDDIELEQAERILNEVACPSCNRLVQRTDLPSKSWTSKHIHIFPKLKTLLLIGTVEILALVVVRNLQSGDVQFMGYHAFSIGNRKVLVKPPPGTQLLTTPAEIKKRLQVDQLAFALVGDSSHSDMPSLKADYFLAGEYDDLAKLLSLLEQDTSAILVLKNIEGDRLNTIHSVQQEGYDSLFYVISRITKCYPYYLRVRSSWYGSRSVPHSIEQGLEAIEVRR